MGVTVNVQYGCGRKGTPDSRRITRWVRTALDGKRADAELTVRIVGEPESADLNHRWRKRNGPTNVLSFPAEGLERVAPALLGDIVVCAPLVRQEARAQGKPPDAHWAHLIIHGTLHLLGYDHEKSADAHRMESLETRLLAGLGYADPYQA